MRWRSARRSNSRSGTQSRPTMTCGAPWSARSPLSAAARPPARSCSPAMAVAHGCSPSLTTTLGCWPTCSARSPWRGSSARASLGPWAGGTTCTASRRRSRSSRRKRGVPMPYRVAVIGAGFGGIGMAMALKQAGVDDFVVLDRADDLGGTWRDNTYPGLTCDIPSHLYSFSFRPGRWSRRFPPRQEILAYLHEVSEERGLGPYLRFGSGVAAAEFDERRAVWNLTLDDGGTLQATAVVSAVGQLNRPALPDIAGRDDFAGPWWHSARWNHDVDLTGRRVAVVGTGASAIQFVPEVAKAAAHVDVYQRSAPYVLPKYDHPYGPTQQGLFDRFPVLRRADRLRIFLYGELLTSGFVVSRKLLAAPMAMWRRQLRVITDPRLRDKCIPDYVMGCKRVLFSNDWYPTLARPN